MVTVTKISDATGKSNTMDLPITQFAWDYWNNTPVEQRPFIQVCFPALTPDEREFILTGITAAEWDDIFPDEEE